MENGGTVSAFISTAPSLNDGDNIIISGLSTTAYQRISRCHVLGVQTANTFVYQEIQTIYAGIVTDIYVQNIPSLISVGSSIGIGTEVVLNTFNENNILRVRRGLSAGVHTVSTKVNLIPSTYDIF